MGRSKAESAILQSFGANVRRLRVQAGWTQAKLAEIVEVELQTEQKWEAGEINVPLATLAWIVNIICFHALMAPAGLPMASIVSALAVFLLWRHRGNFVGLLKEPADPADTRHQLIAAAASTADA
jgi:transcriptional regulator with XRE-family HTH domain